MSAPVAGQVVEIAPAKINLTLRVLGRRPDGYHEIDSLVAFAAPPAVDVLTLRLGDALGFELVGPGAGQLQADASNLVMQAAEAAARASPGLRVGRFQLDKRLPIAAGIGGGSADAAAALRLLRRANEDRSVLIDWKSIAASIGADVTVCLESRFSLMRGIGEEVTRLADLPPLWAVLANPRVPLSTAAVFNALAAAPVRSGASLLLPVPMFADRGALLARLHGEANDLEAVAAQLCPEIAELCRALSQLEGALVARMSGSGPTCFALFDTPSSAAAGARRLSSKYPRWWVEATALI